MVDDLWMGGNEQSAALVGAFGMPPSTVVRLSVALPDGILTGAPLTRAPRSTEREPSSRLEQRGCKVTQRMVVMLLPAGG